MQYISTRGQTPPVNFIQTILNGLSRDGGLYLPEKVPNISQHLESWKNLSYQALACQIFSLFIKDEISTTVLEQLIRKSYSTFTDQEITPLTFHDQISLLELYHGPTFAFKDIALQFLGNLFEEILQNKNQQINILGATSGDTGSAAIYGIRGKKNISIFILHPAGRISAVQEQQMTAVLDANVYNIAVDGTFDDTQNLVKELFGNLAFRDQYHLAAINSINWARIMAQIVYYFYAAFRFQEQYPLTPLIFAVPTGNFGDIYAGYIAYQMGLPVEKFILATNENNILVRTLETGKYETKTVIPTISPAMDIQVASNFERLVYNLLEDPEQVRSKMQHLKEFGNFSLESSTLKRMQQIFYGSSINVNEVLDTIQKFYQTTQQVIDPHTAIGIAAAKKYTDQPVICLSTAHPAKFPEAIQQALNFYPEMPETLKQIQALPTKCFFAKNNSNQIQQIIKCNN